MPPRPLPRNLSDFGLMSKTASSGVQSSAAPTLDDLLFNQDAVVNQSRRVMDLDEAIAGAESQDSPGFLEQLKDPRVLIPLILGLGGAAAGGGVGAALGGTIGAGANALAGQQVDVKAQAEAIEKLKEERKDAVTELDNSRQRIATAFNTNPEAFVDANGEPLDARIMGWYATGVPLNLSPTARRTAEQRGTRWTNRAEFLTNSLKSAKSSEDARVFSMEMLRHLGDTDPEPGLADALVNTYGTPQFDRVFAAALLDKGPNVPAILYAAENDLPLDHSDVLRMVKLYPKDTSGSKESISDRKLALMDKATRWIADPANTEQVSQIKSAATSPQEGAAALARAALAADPLGSEFLAKEFEKDDFLSDLFSSYGNQLTGEQAVERLKLFGGGKMDELMKETPEEAMKRRLGNAEIEVQAGRSAATKNTVNSVIVLRDRGAQRLSTELPTLGQDAIYDLVDQVYNAALADTPVDAAGKKDMRTFNSLFDNYLKQAIEQNK